MFFSCFDTACLPICYNAAIYIYMYMQLVSIRETHVAYVILHVFIIACLVDLYQCMLHPGWKGARENAKSREIRAIFRVNLALFLRAFPPLIAGFSPICAN